MIRHLSIPVVLTLLLLCPAPARAADILVVTSLDIVQSLTEALTEATSIKVVNLVPEGVAMQGQKAYFKKHGEQVFRAVQEADAVVTVGSVWAGDALYKWARRGNIRIANIDACRPLGGYGAGVPLLAVEGRTSPYVWRSPANLTRMASIVSRDLCQLSPDDAVKIRKNLQVLQSALFRLRSNYEAAFLALDYAELAAFTPDFTCLVDEFGLDIRFYVLTPEVNWHAHAESEIAGRIRREGVRAVVCAWEPGGNGTRAIRGGGASAIVMRPYTRPAGMSPVAALIDWYDGNLSRLVAGLKNGLEE